MTTRSVCLASKCPPSAACPSQTNRQSSLKRLEIAILFEQMLIALLQTEKRLERFPSFTKIVVRADSDPHDIQVNDIQVN